MAAVAPNPLMLCAATLEEFEAWVDAQEER